MSTTPSLQKWIIVISLAINVVLAGYLVGRESMFPPCRGDRHGHMEQAMKTLPADKQAQMKAIMDEFRAGAKENFAEIGAIRDQLRTIMTAETFDADAFRAKAKELNTVFRTNKDAMLEKTIAAAQNMSQEDRTILADILHRPMPPRMGGMPDRDGPPKD